MAALGADFVVNKYHGRARLRRARPWRYLSWRANDAAVPVGMIELVVDGCRQCYCLRCFFGKICYHVKVMGGDGGFYLACRVQEKKCIIFKKKLKS